MTLIVTGAAGFIGSHVARALLARGEQVVGVDNFDAFYDRSLKERNVADVRAVGGDAFTLRELDIRDADELRELIGSTRPEAVFHLAALAGVRPSIRDPKRFAAVNVDGTVALLEAMREAGCDRLVFASSSSVYGNNETVPFAEDHDVSRPISPYAATKRACELVCHTWSHLHGMRIAMLRFFTVFGPGQRPDLAINLFMRRIAAGESVPRFGTGGSSRDYTYVDDVVAGTLAAHAKIAAAEAGFARIWNLGGSSPVTLDELIAAIARTVGREPTIETLPDQPGDVRRTFADLTRSTAELGYAPTTSLAEGLERQWAWMRGG